MVVLNVINFLWSKEVIILILNYKKMWRTLKAFHGYRPTIHMGNGVGKNVEYLMEKIEKADKKERIKQ